MVPLASFAMKDGVANVEKTILKLFQIGSVMTGKSMVVSYDSMKY